MKKLSVKGILFSILIIGESGYYFLNTDGLRFLFPVGKSFSLCCPVSVSFSYQFRRKIVGNPGFWYITGMDFLYMEGFKICLIKF